MVGTRGGEPSSSLCDGSPVPCSPCLSLHPSAGIFVRDEHQSTAVVDKHTNITVPGVTAFKGGCVYTPGDQRGGKR